MTQENITQDTTKNRLKQRNLFIVLLLLAWVALIYGVTIVRMGGAS